MSDDLGFIHVYEPGSGEDAATTLLLCTAPAATRPISSRWGG